MQGDDLIILGQTVEKGFDNLEFKVIPKVDQAALYKEVTKSLTEGTCICLFPEGGSHDRPDLLPLKAGVAVMAMAAMASIRAKNGTQRVKIIPCGLNYFHGHKFRSHVLVEYGKPVEVTDELMDLYEKDKRAACSELLQLVEKRMKSVCHTSLFYLFIFVYFVNLHCLGDCTCTRSANIASYPNWQTYLPT